MPCLRRGQVPEVRSGLQVQRVRAARLEWKGTPSPRRRPRRCMQHLQKANAPSNFQPQTPQSTPSHSGMPRMSNCPVQANGGLRGQTRGPVRGSSRIRQDRPAALQGQPISPHQFSVHLPRLSGVRRPVVIRSGVLRCSQNFGHDRPPFARRNLKGLGVQSPLLRARSCAFEAASLYPLLLILQAKFREHFTFNHGVLGSSPSALTKLSDELAKVAGRKAQCGHARAFS